MVDLDSLPWHDILQPTAVISGALLVGRFVAYLLVRLFTRWTRSTTNELDDEALARLGRPTRWMLPILATRFAMPLAALPEHIAEPIEHVLVVAAILGAGWMGLGAARLIEAIVRARLDIQAADNLRARGLATSTRVLRNIADFIIVVVTGGFILMTFTEVKQVGGAMLASAGVAGLVIGFAAQKSIGTLLAGIQIAITQPMRVDDVVVVEGEWGKIEEITLTYVVVRIWDMRRLVIPVTHFIDKPFQNWTRISADVLGTVDLHLDFSVPVDELRTEFKRILDASDKWDGKIWSLQVTAATERTMTVRPLFGALNSSNQWDLRCEVREKMIRFIHERYPHALPRLRTEIPAA